MQSFPEANQVFMGWEEELSCDVSITREAVIKEMDKLEKTKSPGPDIFSHVLRGPFKSYKRLKRVMGVK